jgi:hypothetical protein
MTKPSYRQLFSRNPIPIRHRYLHLGKIAGRESEERPRVRRWVVTLCEIEKPLYAIVLGFLHSPPILTFS